MKRRFLYILFFIIIFFIIILFTREIIINYDNTYKSSEKLSRDDIITLLNKGSNYNNYYRSINTENGKEEFFYKDGILVNYINSNLKYWMNLSENNKEMIVIEDSENKIASIVDDFDTIPFPMEMTQLGYYSTVYDKENFDFNYKGIIKLNNRDTFIVETSSNNINFPSSLKIKYYIDKETGVIVKRMQFSKFAFFTKQFDVFDRGIQFNIVTDEDIKKPDLTEYDINTTAFPTLTIW